MRTPIVAMNPTTNIEITVQFGEVLVGADVTIGIGVDVAVGAGVTVGLEVGDKDGDGIVGV